MGWLLITPADNKYSTQIPNQSNKKGRRTRYLGTLSPNPWDNRFPAIPGFTPHEPAAELRSSAGLVSPLSRRSGCFPASLSSAQVRLSTNDCNQACRIAVYTKSLTDPRTVLLLAITKPARLYVSDAIVAEY